MSGSLIFIAVVWIVLLAPLLLRNQSPVRRTAKALTETRVLHEGGTSLQRKRRLKPAQSLYAAHDDDDELELVDAEPEFYLFEDEGERPKSLRERTSRFSRKPVTAKDDEASEAKEQSAAKVEDINEDELETVDAEVVDAASLESEDAVFSSSDATGASAEESETIDGEVVAEEDSAADSEAETESESKADAKADTDVDAEADAENTSEGETTEASTFRGTDETDTGVFKPVRLVATKADTKDIPVAYFRGSDLDATAEIEEAERGIEQGEKEQAAAATQRAEEERLAAEASRAELDDEEIAYLAARKGRGVYDPEASRRATERRQQRRKQIVLVLLGLCAVTLAFGVIVGGAAWLATVAAVALTALYLYFLRLNALEEARMRQRRIARMRRARLGVRNTEDGELGVPNRLRRPGAVIVESDDADPEFEHLEYIHGSDYFDDYDGTYNGHRGHDQRQRARAV